MLKALPISWGFLSFIFLVILILGLLSSVITAIIAAIVLVELILVINLDKKTETNIVIIACFAIGLGAALTPIGEPLSTIVVSKMQADFWFLARNFGVFIKINTGLLFK